MSDCSMGMAGKVRLLPDLLVVRQLSLEISDLLCYSVCYRFVLCVNVARGRREPEELS